MTAPEVKQCLYLLSTLWSNYKPPQDKLSLDAAISVWLRFFANVPIQRIEKVLFEIAADGGEFAPQVGAVYARLKANSAALPPSNASSEYEKHMGKIIAGIMEIQVDDPLSHDDFEILRERLFRENNEIRARKKA